MPSALRSTVKRVAQKVLGQGNVRDFVRTRRLWLDKNAAWKNDKLYLPPVKLSELPVNLPMGG